MFQYPLPDQCTSGSWRCVLILWFPHLVADARLLQQILLHPSPFNHSVVAEEDLQVFAEAAGVVVADGFSVSERCVRYNMDAVHVQPGALFMRTYLLG